MPVCITGMHRSGTSMVARLLQRAGLYLGEETWSGRAADEEGFSEHGEFVRLDEELLDRLGGAWDRPPSPPAGWERGADLADVSVQAADLCARSTAASRGGFKDPRAALLLPSGAASSQGSPSSCASVIRSRWRCR